MPCAASADGITALASFHAADCCRRKHHSKSGAPAELAAVILQGRAAASGKCLIRFLMLDAQLC